MVESNSSGDQFPPELESLLYRHRDQLDAGLFSEADESLEAIMGIVLEQALKHVETDSDFQERMLAHAYESRGEWSSAQAVYEHRLAHCDPNDLNERANRFKDLACFHAALSELNLASFYQAQATYYYRQSKFADVGLWFWLAKDAVLANQQGRYLDARDAADEALMQLSDERSGDQMRSMLLISRARSQFGLGNLDAAEANHVAAWEYLAPWDAFATAVGVLNTFAGWWGLGACLWEKRGDIKEARHCWERSIEYSRRAVESWDEGDHHMLLPLTRSLVEFGQFLLRHGEQAEAAEHFAESDQIRSQFNLAPLEHP